MYRPEGWELKQPFTQYDQGSKEGDSVTARILTPSEKALFEAGADAMLEGLKAKITEDPRGYGLVRDEKRAGWFVPDNIFKEGYLIFIPGEV